MIVRDLHVSSSYPEMTTQESVTGAQIYLPLSLKFHTRRGMLSTNSAEVIYELINANQIQAHRTSATEAANILVVMKLIPAY